MNLHANGIRIVGIAGNIGAGKTLAASMIPGAFALQWADPIYRGLAALLGISEDALRDRTNKERTLEVAGVQLVPRQLLQTLGTEWGRDLIHPDLWVRLTMARIEAEAAAGRRTFAICGTRFHNEVAAIRAAGGQVWWIERPGTATGGHTSDLRLSRRSCDRVIENDGTVEILRRRVVAAWHAYTETPPCLAS
jgi:hypothetical protein